VTTIASLHPGPATGGGPVRPEHVAPWVDVLLPQHVLAPDGSDPLEWESRTTSDEDEVETECFAGSLRAVVQHSLSETTWRVRASIVNTGTEPVSVSGARLTVAPGEGQAWAWAAGSAGLLAVDPGSAGVWALSLRRGSLTRSGNDLVWLPAGTTVQPARRVTVELAGRRCGGWHEVASMLPAWVPVLAVRGDEPVDLALPDAGVVAAGCAIAEAPEGTEIRGAGMQRVSVRGSFGEVRLELAFAPTMADAVEGGVRQIVGLLQEESGGPEAVATTDAAGASAILDRTARRLIVLQAGRAHDAADVVAARLVPDVIDLVRTGDAAGPFVVASLAGEVQRRDDPRSLQALLDALRQLGGGPGVVVALTRVWAALWGLGRDPEPVRQALARVSALPALTRLEAIERSLMVGDRDGVARLHAALGGGLPGEALPAWEPWEAAYAVALTSLLADDDPAAPAVVQAAELVARRLTAAHPDDPDVLAWLLLGER
jgi:stage V sporulation protein SpoVS